MLLPGSYKGTRKRRWARPRTVDEIFGIEKERPLINRDRYAGDAVIRAKDVKNGQVVTIDWFKEMKSSLRDKPMQPALQLSEFPDALLPLNVTNLDALLDKFGEDEEKWKGKKIKLMVVSVNTPEGEPTKGIRIAF